MRSGRRSLGPISAARNNYNPQGRIGHSARQSPYHADRHRHGRDPSGLGRSAAEIERRSRREVPHSSLDFIAKNISTGQTPADRILDCSMAPFICRECDEELIFRELHRARNDFSRRSGTLPHGALPVHGPPPPLIKLSYIAPGLI